MSSAKYRLEAFQSWNPVQENAQSSWKPLNPCRYPSPVSITTTLSPSNPRKRVSESQKIYSPRPERHPLPVRPPVEVCLYGGLQSDTQIARSEPEALGRPPSINQDVEAFEFKDFPHVQDLPGSGNVDHPPLFDNIGYDSEYQLFSFESGDPELGFTADQHSQVGPPGNPTQTGDLSDDASIDPAIMDDYHFADVEEIQAADPKYIRAQYRGGYCA